MLVVLSILIGLCSMAMLTAGFLVFWRNREKADYRWFFVLSISIGIWIVFNFVDSNIVKSWTDLFVKLDFSFALLVGLAMLQFVSLTVGLETRRAASWVKSLTSWRSLAKLLGVIVGFSVLIFANKVVTTTIKSESISVNYGPLFWPYALAVVGLIGAAIYILIIGYLNSARSHRRKLTLIVFGLVVAAVTNLLTNLLFPLLINSREVIQALNLFGYLGIFIFVACLYVAITTRKLFDLRLVIVRSLVYTIVIGLVSVFYALVVTVFANFFVQDQPQSIPTLVVSLIATILVASTFQYLKRAVDRVTSRLFFRDTYSSSEVLSALSDITTSTVDIDRLLSQSGQLLLRALKSSEYFFALNEHHALKLSYRSESGRNYRRLIDIVRPYLKSKEPIIAEMLDERTELSSALRRTNIEVIIFLNIKDTPIGLIGFGLKRNGTAYTQKDVRLLNNAAASLSVAIQNALRFEEIERFNLTLQNKVEEATRKLRRTNEKLRRLDQTKDDFISMASHQLRTPLTSVKGYVSMVLDGDAGRLSAMQRKLLNQSFISAQRMVYLISDLLNVSRLRTGKFTIEPIASNLADVIRGEIDQLIETAESRNLTLTYHRPEHFPTLMLDETKLRQVIMNFIDNAIYYTPSGGHITVSLVEKPQTVEFTVVDDGIGVPKHEQHHLFGKFYRADNAKRARPDGTGLGLFMAKKVIIAQGGAIIFKSQEGKGSTFGFSFAKNRLLPSNQPVLTTKAVHK